MDFLSWVFRFIKNKLGISWEIEILETCFMDFVILLACLCMQTV